MEENTPVTQIMIRALDGDKFTIRTTYINGRSTGRLVTSARLREIVDEMVITNE